MRQFENIECIKLFLDMRANIYYFYRNFVILKLQNMLIRLSILLEYDAGPTDKKHERALEASYAEGKRIVTVEYGESYRGTIRSVYVQRGTKRDFETYKSKAQGPTRAKASNGRVQVSDASVSKGSLPK
jgi:hypothetical protein